MAMKKHKKLIALLTAIKKEKEPQIPFNLHDGLRKLIVAFGDADNAIAFLKEVEDTDI